MQIKALQQEPFQRAVGIPVAPKEKKARLNLLPWETFKLLEAGRDPWEEAAAGGASAVAVAAAAKRAESSAASVATTKAVPRAAAAKSAKGPKSKNKKGGRR